MLKQLSLHDFRNHQSLDLQFDKITILVGPNGAGKTNLVEALRLISLQKSFRTRFQAELIRWGGEVARVRVRLDSGDLEVVVTPSEKVTKVNGVRTSPVQALGNLKTVLFVPQDVGLLAGAPLLRRRFLDGILAQRERFYVPVLAIFERLLKLRNATLALIKAGRRLEQDLDPWDEQLIEPAGRLHEARRRLADFFNTMLSKVYREVAGQPATLKLDMKWSLLSQENLIGSRDRDIDTASTTVGPHHDDFHLLLDGKDLGRFGSRGENRTAVLALKIAELEYLAAEGSAPVLLLDDIFSELDHDRRARLQAVIKDHQTVITTTDEHYIAPALKENATIVELAPPSLIANERQ